MPDPYGLSEGVKALSGSLDSTREATKGLSKSIENIQHDVIDVAQKQAQDRTRARREAEFKKEQALLKALKQWQHKKQISDEEARLKIDFVKKHGAKEWEAVLKIKLDIENLERKNNEEYQHDLKEVRRVQFYCFAVAAVIAWYLTWGYKQF
jgi:translation initiation factor 2 alpha subunit (eIF-2alpha)